MKVYKEFYQRLHLEIKFLLNMHVRENIIIQNGLTRYRQHECL